MALINCPECGKQISDKAERCIQCGFRINNYNEPTNYQQQYTGTNHNLNRDEQKGQGSGIASFILGFFALIAWTIPLFGYPICITGIILGSISLSKLNNGNAVAGLILSILGLIATIINSIVGAVMWSQILSN